MSPLTLYALEGCALAAAVITLIVALRSLFAVDPERTALRANVMKRAHGAGEDTAAIPRRTPAPLFTR